MSFSLPPVPLETFDQDHWRSRLTDICGHFQTRTDRKNLTGRADLFQKGTVDFALVGHNANEITRSTREISRDGDAYYFLIIQLAGIAELEQGSTRAVLKQQGDMTLIDSTRPCTFRTDPMLGSDQLSIHIPRHLLHACGYVTSFDCAQRLASKDEESRLLNQHLRVLLKSTDGSRSQHHLSNAFLELVRAVFVENGDDNRAVESSRRMQHLIAVIHDHALEEDFSVSRLAEITGISKSGIFRTFQAYDLSCNDMIKRVRISRFKRELENRIHYKQDFRIAELAFDCGFKDISTFNRTFKAEIGMAPRAYSQHLARVRQVS
jgi:AraC-like DNA-binding protein